MFIPGLAETMWIIFFQQDKANTFSKSIDILYSWVTVWSFQDLSYIWSRSIFVIVIFGAFNAAKEYNYSMTELRPVWPDWSIYWTLGNFLKPLATTNLPKSPTFLGIFWKGVKFYHFSSEIIFRQLLWTLGDFFWSHWLRPTASYCLLLTLSMKEFVGTGPEPIKKF